MGQEIDTTDFSSTDEELFRKKLKEETKILKRWFDERAFEDGTPKCGLELEAWLVDKDFVPAPSSDQFIDKLGDDYVVPEISKFNFELNTDPYDIEERVFSQLESDTLEIWKKCEAFAEKMDLKSLLIGTLPTLRDYMLTIDNLSPQKRYFALNNRIMQLRGDRPVILDIEGRDELKVEHQDIITECAATSLQIHFGVTQDNGPRYYNASIVSSSFMAAIGANSPFFYGKELWDESRIPIFEQSVNLKSFRRTDGKFATRVSLGNGYVRKSLMELFIENFDGHPVLLPDHHDSDPEWLDHVRLHNGTIWRWNRPLIGMSKNNRPCLRLEFRVPSAGPTVIDSMANMVFQIGLVQFLYEMEDLTDKIPFETANENFYQCCKHGLAANITWVDGKKRNVQSLIMDQVLPGVRDGLKSLGIAESETQKYIDEIISPRIRKGQNGATWQKEWVHTHGNRFQELLEQYYQYQKENLPVHLWSV